jgi:ABC-type phosphate transport system substrate-binding protein
MRFLSARRLVPACVISAAAVAALVAPGAATASLGAQCSGVNISGQGASFQKIAQEIWTAGFNTSSEKHACNGTQGTGGTPTVKYTPSGSGAGLKSWGVGKVEHKYDATNAFVSSDEAPNPTAKAEIEENETTFTPKALATIPVVQGADAIIAHLPTNCKATSTSNKGRLVLNNKTLEEVWRGTITKWSEIKDNGDTLTGTGCNPETPITHVVRLDGSGTTHIFKKYLGLINKATWEGTNVKGEAVGARTWDETAEGSENTTWPTADAVVRGAANGNGALVAKVVETPSSIGYSDLATARANSSFVPPTGGANTAFFWMPIQNKEGETVTYADPASNKEVAKTAEANCASEEYTNGEAVFPPSSVLESWSEVTTKTQEPHYTICGLTFSLAFVSYSSFPGTTLEETTTVNNYLQYVVDTVKETAEFPKRNGGQALIKLHDYKPLTGTVLKEAKAGAAKVAF